MASGGGITVPAEAGPQTSFPHLGQPEVLTLHREGHRAGARTSGGRASLASFQEGNTGIGGGRVGPW